jgi:hypothetical protein
MMEVKSCLQGFIVILVILFSGGGIYDLYAKDSQPWLNPMNPSKLEWLVLQKQADEGDTEFGENGLTVNFYLGDKSYETGVIYCDIDYLPDTSAELVQKLEESIQRRFQKLARSKLYPWAKVKIIKNVVK